MIPKIKIKRTETFYKQLLIGYWIFSAIIFYIYVYMTMLRLRVDFPTFLSQSPNIALAQLVVLLQMIQLICLLKWRASKAFLLSVIVQQCLCFNFIGAGIAFMYFEHIKYQSTPLVTRDKYILRALSIFVVFLTCIVFVNGIRLFLGY